MSITNDAFMASLSFTGDIEKKAKVESDVYSVDYKETLMSKYAGINIYQPTKENIELFIHKYVLNELSFLPETPNISIELNPVKQNISKPEYLDEANGQVIINIKGITIDLPFIVIDSELLPFDIIRLGQQRVPYSRENIRKVLMGIYEDKKDRPAIEEFDPYIGLEDKVNPTTSTGFLGDVLRIQEQYTNRMTDGNNMFVTSEKKVDELLEKLSSMKPMTEKDWKLIEGIFKEALVRDEQKELLKTAQEITDNGYETIFKNIEKINFVDANTLENGTPIAFPEITKNEVCVNKGVVLSNFMKFPGVKVDESAKVIITKDQKMKILDKKDKFLCMKVVGSSFKLKQQEIDTVEADDIITAFDGDKSLFPAKVCRIMKVNLDNDISWDYLERGRGLYSSPQAGDNLSINITHVEFFNKDLNQTVYYSSYDKDEFEMYARTDKSIIKLVPLCGCKFSIMTYKDYISKKAKELCMSETDLVKHLDPHKICSERYQGEKSSYMDKVIAIDPNLKIVSIEDSITGYMRDKKDMYNMANEFFDNGYGIEINKKAFSDNILNKLYDIKNVEKIAKTITDNTYDKNLTYDESFARNKEMLLNNIKTAQKITGDDFEIFKKASSNEFVEIRLKDKEKDTYDIKINYIDRSGKNFSNVDRDLKGIEYEEVRKILKALNYSIQKVSEIMSKAKQMGYARYELMRDSSPNKMLNAGSSIKKPLSQKMQKVKRTIFDNKISDALSADIIGSLLAGSLLRAQDNPVVNALSSFANDSRVLSSAFEKTASEKKSKSLLKVAKILSLSAMLNDKVKDVIEKEAQYPLLNKAVKDIVSTKEYLEKTAYDLINLKLDQYKNKHFIVNPSYIQGAINQIDNLYKVASILNKYAENSIDTTESTDTKQKKEYIPEYAPSKVTSRDEEKCKKKK